MTHGIGIKLILQHSSTHFLHISFHAVQSAAKHSLWVCLLLMNMKMSCHEESLYVSEETRSCLVWDPERMAAWWGGILLWRSTCWYM